MSKQVDERIVSMQFDNKHFEANVKTTMNTLDKLKEKLSFKDSNKGFGEINKAAKKTDLSPLAKSVETVQAKFSALDVIGTTALVNLTNSAISAGKKMISALTLDPVLSGFKEYETQINAVQTILANTKSKGSTIDDVNRALDELNLYADKTIYNFTEMTRNIGTFTAAGVDLDTSTNAIKGIANLAAMSGSTSQQASTAMYQLSQALASGTVKLMDWNSVVNAGMGGQVFQDALKQTARTYGVAIDSMIESEGSFRETLKDGWLTSEILTETLQHFTLAAEEGTEQWNEYKESLMSQGYAEEEALQILELSNTATEAATKVKTFTQLWDVMKESAQSGWAQTWKLIIGDYEEAKALLSPLADFLTGAIQSFDGIRNTIIKAAMSSPFTAFAEKVASIATVTESVTEKLQDYEDVVNRIINGEFGNGQARFDKLAEQGYDWAHAQNLVNERLGDATRHATDYTEAVVETTEQVKALTDEELRNLDFTEDEIKMYRELEKQAEETGVSINELIENMSQKDGRTMMWEGLGNIGKSIAAVFSSIKNAWVDIFPPEELGLKIYNVISGFYELSQKLVMSDESADKLKRTFKGVFAVLDIVTTIVGGPIKLAFKVLSQLLGAANLDFLTITAYIGDAIVGFRDFIDSAFNLTGVFKKILPYLTFAADAIRGWVSAIRESGIVQDIISGFANGIQNGISKVCSVIAEFGSRVLETLRKVFDTHSPSKKTFEIAQDVMEGFFEGLKAFASKIFGYLKSFGKKCIDVIKKIPFDKVFAIALSAVSVYVGKKAFDIAEAFSAPMDGLGETLEGIGKMLTQFGKGFNNKMKAQKWDAIAKTVTSFAIAIGVMAASVYFLAKLDTTKMWTAVAAVATLAVVVTLMAEYLNSVSSTMSTMTIGKDGIKTASTAIKTSIISLGVSLLLMATVIKMIGGMELGKAIQGTAGLIILLVAMVKVIKYMDSLIVSPKAAANLKALSKLLKSLARTLILLVVAFKLIDLLSVGEIGKGILALIGLLNFVKILVKVTTVAPGTEIAKISGLLWSVSGALLMMVGVCKLAGMLSVEDFAKGAVVLLGFLEFLHILRLITLTAPGLKTAKLGGLLLSVSTSLLLMVGVCKLAGMLSADDMIKGGLFAFAFLNFVKVLVRVTTVAPGTEIAKVGFTVLAMSVAIGILAGLCVLMGSVDIKTLGKGVAIVGILGLLMRTLITATKGANSSIGYLIVMTVAIGIMAGAIAALACIKDVNSALKAASALALVIGAFALMIKATSKIESGLGKSLTILITLTVIVGALAFVICKLQDLNPEDVIQKAAAIGTLLLTMSASFRLISGATGGMNWGALGKNFVGMVGMVAIVAGLAYALAKIPSMQNSVSNILGIAALMAAMTLLLIPLSLIGSTFNLGEIMSGVLGLLAMCVPLVALAGILCLMNNVKDAKTSVMALIDLAYALTLLLVPLTILGAIMVGTGGAGAIAVAGGIAALLVMCVPLVALAGILCLMNCVDDATTSVNSLVTLMTAMTELMLKLTLVGPLAIIGLSAIGALTAAIVAIGGLAVGIGYLFDKFPQLEKFVDKGLPVLEKLATGIGTMIGNFMGGMIGGVLNAITELPLLGQRLSEFMTNADSFIVGAKKVDESVVKAAGYLARSVVALAAADFIQGIYSFLSFGSSFAELGSELSLFMTNADGFIEGAKKLDPNLLTSVERLVEIVKTLNSESFTSVIKNWVTDNASLKNFCTGLKDLGTGINDFASELKFDTSSVTTVGAAASALQIIASCMPQINECTNMDVDTFKTKLAGLGEALKAFTQETKRGKGGIEVSVSKFTEDELATIVRQAKALAELAGAMKDIPDGVETKFPNVGMFVNSVAVLHESMKKLSTVTSGGVSQAAFTQSELDTIVLEAQAIGKLVEAAKQVDGINADESNWVKIFGQNDFYELARGMQKMQGAFAGLKNKDGSAAFTQEDAKTIGLEIQAISDLANVVKPLSENKSTFDKVIDWLSVGGESTLNELAGGLKSITSAFKKILTDNADLFTGTLDADGNTTGVAIDNISNLAKAITDIGTAAQAIPQESNWFDTVFGDRTISDFGTNIKKMAEEVKGIVDDKYTFDSTELAQIESVGTAITTLQNATTNITDISGSNVKSFGDGLGKLAEGLKNYLEDMKDVTADGVNKTKAAIEAAIGVLDLTVNKDFSSLSNFATSLETVAKEGVSKFTGAFTAENVKANMTNAVNSFVTTGTTAINSQANIALWTAAGKNAVQGFINGLKDKIKLTEVAAAGKDIGDTARIATEAALNEHSPSKEMHRVGAFAVEGFVNGIADNLKSVDSSGRSIGTGVLTSLQDELKINSPSLVMNEQGHWIVKGIAKGIEEETEAEKKAKEKAQAIINAFQKEFDKIDIKSTAAQLDLENWKLEVDMKGGTTDYLVNMKEQEFYEGEAKRISEGLKLAQDKLPELIKYDFKDGSPEYEAAENEVKEWQKKQNENNKKLRELTIQAWSDNIQYAQDRIELNDSEYEAWLAIDGKTASTEKLYQMHVSNIDKNHVWLVDIQNRAKWKLEWLRDNNGTQKEIAEATKEYNEAAANVAKNEAERAEIESNRKYDSRIQTLENMNESYENELNLWKAQNADASEAAVLQQEIATLSKQSVADATAAYYASAKYFEVLKNQQKGLANEEDVRQAYNAYILADIKALNTSNQLTKKKRDLIREQRDETIDIAELASEIAEQEYNVWEKTTGRKATDTEKDLKRLEVYARQMESQRTIYDIALENMKTAEQTYGRESQEYRDAYRSFLTEQSELVNLQDEILTMQEDIQKRQKRQYNKQQLAMSEYKDYIKKYKQYYLDHGLTMEQLEEDAKAAANYDPSKTVENVVNKTSDALSTALSTSGAISLGSSYVEAVSTGMTNSIPSVQSTTQSVLDACSDILKDIGDEWLELGKKCVGSFGDGINQNRATVITTITLSSRLFRSALSNTVEWNSTGKQCILGFANGMKSNVSIAKAAAAYVANEAIAAAREAFDVNSPSKVFWETAKYCVEGLANGFVDNSDLSDMAVKSMAEEAVDSFTRAIQQITDAVDSEMDTQPTIRPVLDLSNVEKGAARLSTMFSSDRAFGISAMRNSDISQNQNGADASSNEGKTINYVQNNYSPKALSPTDIYRRTKNQLSAMKGVL